MSQPWVSLPEGWEATGGGRLHPPDSMCGAATGETLGSATLQNQHPARISPTKGFSHIEAGGN